MLLLRGGNIADTCTFCMVKACNTADANYSLTALFHAQTNAIYRFYVYDLVIDDPTIIHGQYWPLQNLGSTNLSRLIVQPKKIARRTYNQLQTSKAA